MYVPGSKDLVFYVEIEGFDPKILIDDPDYILVFP